MSAHITSTASQNTYIIETATIAITSHDALKAPKANLTTLISKGKV